MLSFICCIKFTLYPQYPKDEQQLAAPVHHHPVPPLELPHPFAESVDVSTAPAMTAGQELLLPPDSSPASKVRVNAYCCMCQLSTVGLYSVWVEALIYIV